MVTIIELGTGVNGQIIGTSTHWRVELWTSLLLTLMIIPLSYTLTNKYGLIGPAYANLVSFSVYNFIRYYFLWKKFNLQPFTFKTLELLIMATATYFLVDVCFSGLKESWFGLLGSCAMYGLIYAGWIYKRKLSPDVHQLLETLENRLRRK
jgi:O-antigen/teichoic acid export membrane protein